MPYKMGDLYRFEIDLAKRKIDEICKEANSDVDLFTKEFAIEVLLRCLDELQKEWHENFVEDQDC